jgi:hypothetical protein
MASVLDIFGCNGADLLKVVARQALESKGSFSAAPQATTLALTVAYAEAAANAFAVIAAEPGLGAEDRAKMQRAATIYRQAQATIATRMPGPRGSAALPSLANGGGLADLILPTAQAPVMVTAEAQAAIEGLRRDPVLLASEGRDAVLLLMQTVNDGLVVAP